MRIFVLAILCAAIFSSCGFFSRKMNEQLKEANVQLEKQVDSLKLALVKQREEDIADSLFSPKLDTLYTSGFKLAALADSISSNPGYDSVYTAELNFFRNYVNRNFNYSDQVASLMPTLNMGHDMQGQEMPLGLNATKEVMHTMAKQSIMQILGFCREQEIVKTTS